ncbi:peptide deformylase [Proteiniphilum sp. UBA5384]|uniref:peptide deformylase n=1 Tax=Proteiniphilum sp. UBA5384 TaxID=1947279 RepID=UPI0025F37DE6|nr:peptide deformylase [Proteiniphilum sp. UBA5384]
MILPIVCYRHNILRKHCDAVFPDDPMIMNLIKDMRETLNAADGCGLAAPQVNRLLQLFVVNSCDTYLNMGTQARQSYFEGDTGIEETFINAEITEYGGEEVADGEGCLSIPDLWEAVNRSWRITIKYHDRQFREQVPVFSGYTARVLQYEYDHILGILYIDRLSASRR